MIETYGMAGAIEAADAMLKAANVQFLGSQKVDRGRIMVSVSGDVGAVQAAVDAGSAACRRMGVLMAAHVIPRPDPEVEKLLPSAPGQAPKMGRGKPGTGPRAKRAGKKKKEA